MVATANRAARADRQGQRRDKWRPRLLIRYTLLQLPGTLLLVLVLVGIRRWWDIPAWAAGIAVAMWIFKDMLLYPFVWSAYDWDRVTDNFSMLDREAIVVERLDPTGYVRVRGELWKASVAEGDPPVERGATVTVREVRGLRLIVTGAR